MGKETATQSSFGRYRTTADTIERRPAKGPFRPRYQVDQATFERLRLVERLDNEVRRLDAYPDAARRLLRESLARNAYGTASIEGNPLSLEEVESLLAKSLTPDNAVEPDEREILNYAAIIRTIHDHPFPHRVADVDALHEDYFEGVLPQRGSLKDRANFIGDRGSLTVVYVPTPPADTARELQALLDWVHEADEHPLVRASVFFHEFQSIHPYIDGNGRLGRLLTTLFLHHAGYEAIRYAIMDQAANLDREAYYDALQQARRDDWDRTPWIRHQLQMIEDGYRFARDGVLLIDRLPPTLKERQERIAEWFARFSWRRTRRAVKFADVQAAFPAVPRRTLTHDLAALSESGVLLRQGVGRGTTYRFQRTANADPPFTPQR